MSDNSTEISFAELRAAIERLLEQAERRFGPSVQLDANEYWSIFPSDAFNLEVKPPPLGAGELSDDVAVVRDVLRGRHPYEDGMLWHDLDHLCGILQRISHLAGADARELSPGSVFRNDP